MVMISGCFPYQYSIELLCGHKKVCTDNPPPPPPSPTAFWILGGLVSIRLLPQRQERPHLSSKYHELYNYKHQECSGKGEGRYFILQTVHNRGGQSQDLCFSEKLSFTDIHCHLHIHPLLPPPPPPHTHTRFWRYQASAGGRTHGGDAAHCAMQA